MESIYSMMNTLEEETSLASQSTTTVLPERGSHQYAKRYNLKDVIETSHSSTKDVDMSVRIMDLKYNTQFYDWIKDPECVDHIAYHVKRVIVGQDPSAISLGLKWMIAEWPVSSIASLLIKIFYENGLNNKQFTSVVSDLCNGTEWSQVIDLIATLIIGEDASMTAKFIYAVTQTWQPATIMDLVMAVGARSRWKNEYMESFIVNYASLNPAIPVADRVARVQDLQQKFAERASVLERLPHEKSHVAIPGHRIFSRRLLEAVVVEDSRWEASALQNKRLSRDVGSMPTTMIDIPSESGHSSPLSLASSPMKSPIYHS
jgi:hypothetical protein